MFELRLARELGIPRDQLLDSITQREFLDWLALQSIEPFFDPWLANAVNCRVTAAAAGTNAPVTKFLPVKPLKRKQTAEELKAAMRRKMVRRGPN